MNAVLPKFDTEANFTITAASLASSTNGAGRQSTLIDNTTTRYKRVRVVCKCALNTTSAAIANTAVFVHLLRGDKAGTPIRDDNAGASDAALTVVNADLLGVLNVKSTPAPGDVLYKEFIFEDPGPEFGIAIWQNTGQALAASGHQFSYIGEYDEIQ